MLAALPCGLITAVLNACVLIVYCFMHGGFHINQQTGGCTYMPHLPTCTCSTA